MAKVREVLGHVCVESASAKRKCHRNNAHAITCGEQHLAIYDGASGGRKNYCQECARPILDRARADLQSLVIALYGDVAARERTN